jgi:hypothetical protein
MVILSTSWQMQGYYLKVGHDRFIPHLKLIIHLSFFHPTIYRVKLLIKRC